MFSPSSAIAKIATSVNWISRNSPINRGSSTTTIAASTKSAGPIVLSQVARERPHTRLTTRWPNNPCGSIRSTTSSTTSAAEPELTADELDVGPEHVDQDPEDETADDRAQRAVDPAQHGRGEGVDEDDQHQVRVEELRGRSHHPGNRTQDGGETPPERQHPADADAREAARVLAVRDGLHREADRREPEERPEKEHGRQADREDADVLVGDQDASDLRRPLREGSRTA